MKQERTLGEKIVYYRHEKGYTQWELAEISGVSRGQLSKIENDKVVPSLNTLVKLEDALGLPFMTLHGSVKKSDETAETVIRDLKYDLLRRDLPVKTVRIIANVAMVVADSLEENL